MVENLPSAAGSREEKPPRRVYIEIGTGTVPAAVWGERRPKENEIYVGIDLDFTALSRARDAAAYAVRAGQMEEGETQFLRADARRLPLADASADEILLSNLLGYEAKVSPEDRKKIIGEVERVLAPNGKLIIKETITPLDYIALEDSLAGANFAVEKIFDRQAEPEAFEAERRKYEGETNFGAKYSYIVVLRKAPLEIGENRNSK